MVTIEQAIQDLQNCALIKEDRLTEKQLKEEESNPSTITTEGELIILLEELQRLRKPKVKSLNKKITIQAGNKSYSYVQDYTEYAEVLVECRNYYNDTKEKMTNKNIYRYFEDGTFENFEELNGIHFVYGVLESFSQSAIGRIFYSELSKSEENDFKIIIESI